MTESKKYVMTFGSDHKFPLKSLEFFCEGKESDCSRTLSKTFKVREGAYAFCYTKEEFDDIGMDAPSVGWVFCDEQNKTQKIQSVIKDWKKDTKCMVICKNDVQYIGDFQEFNGSAFIITITDKISDIFVSIDYEGVLAILTVN